MVINILSTHRFHLLDLARELSRQGHDVHFYSYVSPARCAEFGFDSRCATSFFWFIWPFFALERIVPKKLHHQVIWYRNLLIDWFVSKTMRRCDICIGIGTVYLKAFAEAKSSGAVTVLEWGSKHIVEQQQQFGTLDAYPARFLHRELTQYQSCDYISIPSSHVCESFVRQGIPASRLWVNPYGVDLSQFYPKTAVRKYDLIFVGGWRYEKGCDLLVKLAQQYGYSLLHVGSIVNMDFPELPNLKHVDPVDQQALVDYYALARVFVLPSRAEGLAMVQAQALACGLPVVCSKETGGRDLRALVENPDCIIEMEDLSLSSLYKSVLQVLQFAAKIDRSIYQRSEKEENTQESIDRHVDKPAYPVVPSLSWESYGKRYSAQLARL